LAVVGMAAGSRMPEPRCTATRLLPAILDWRRA
jgi:hypothetical protein